MGCNQVPHQTDNRKRNAKKYVTNLNQDLTKENDMGKLMPWSFERIRSGLANIRIWSGSNNHVERSLGIVALVPNDNELGKEGYLVVVDSTNKVTLVSASTDVPYGVIIEGANTTGRSIIALIAGGYRGTARVKVNSVAGLIQPGLFLAVASNGTVKGDPTAGARVLIGQALETGASNAMIDAILFKPIVF
jgi:hypothetical protein